MVNIINLICEGCNISFTRLMKVHKQNMKANKKIYCSQSCFYKNKGPYKGYEPSVQVLCNNCNIIFNKFKSKLDITSHNFCSMKCKGEFEKGQVRKVRVNLICPICIKNFDRRISYINRKKSKNLFCSKSCYFIYKKQNSNILRPPKLKGVKRSKLEIFIESKIKEEFPNLISIYNGKYSGYELDIYLPTLSIAIEINGPFHYFPIFGNENLIKVQNRDKLKVELCKTYQVNFLVIPLLKAAKSNKSKLKFWNQIKIILLEQLNCKSYNGKFPDEISETLCIQQDSNLRPIA